MNAEESRHIADTIHSQGGYARVDRTYPHPVTNKPHIIISVRNNDYRGTLVVAHLSEQPTYGGGTGTYRSIVHSGQPLDTRIRTAFRKMVEEGERMAKREEAYRWAQRAEQVLWSQGIVPLVRQAVPSWPPHHVVPNYARYWPMEVCSEITRLCENARTWIAERHLPWNERLVTEWRESMGGGG